MDYHRSGLSHATKPAHAIFASWNLVKVGLSMCRFLTDNIRIPGILAMNRTKDRRRAPRLKYRVTVRLAEDAKNMETASEGQMLDVSSGGMAFRYNVDGHCPRQGQSLVVHFSIPNSKVHDASMMEFTRTGRVLRVQEVNSTLHNIAVRFDEPLPVGKVYFDEIGLFLPNPKRQEVSTNNRTGTDEGESFESMLEQRIKELEQELAELKQLQSHKDHLRVANYFQQISASELPI